MKIFLVGLFIIQLTSDVTSYPAYSSKELKRQKLHSLLHSSVSVESSTKCTVCKDVTAFLHGLGSVGIGENELKSIASYICEKFKLTTNRVCTAGVQEFADEVWNVFIDAFIVPNELCGWVIGESCAHFVNYYSPWNVSIPERTKVNIRNPWKDAEKATPTYKFLHISDIHLDNDYMEGSKADCSEPLCCRKQDGMAGKEETAAPKWGYHGYCDSNINMVQNMFETISTNHSDIEYIIWTGDVPPHDVWNQTREDQINAIKEATNLLTKYFPNKKVYPCLGNHEGDPVNSFPPPYVTGEQSGSWLLDALADDWGTWLPEDTKDTIKKGGYYTVLLQKGFRIVSLNMNYGNTGNWWLWINSTDPAGQLQWLVSVLLKAEENDEKVHIIGHIPPDATLTWFNYNYFKIIDRFHDTITAQFFGHTHHDEFRVFYDAKTYKTATSIAYVGPSVTTYHYLNPGFRIYDVSAGTTNNSRIVTDHYTYILDLKKIPSTGIPVWELEYSAKSAYGMASLSPSEWSKLVYKMLDDDRLFQILYSGYTKQYVRDTCTGACKKNFLCTMNTALSSKFHNFCDFMSEKEQNFYPLWRGETYTKC